MNSNIVCNYHVDIIFGKFMLKIRINKKNYLPLERMKLKKQLGESRQPWANVCLEPIVFFQKVWKEKFLIFYMKLRK